MKVLGVATSLNRGRGCTLEDRQFLSLSILALVPSSFRDYYNFIKFFDLSFMQLF